jgi:hypothetical protein
VTGISLDPFNPQKVDHQLANIGQPRLSAIQKTPTIDRVDIELSYISDIADASKGKLLIHVKGLSGAGLTNVESWLSIAAKSSVKDRRALLLAFAAVQPNYVRLALLCCIWSNLVEAVSDLEGPPSLWRLASLLCNTLTLGCSTATSPTLAATPVISLMS